MSILDNEGHEPNGLGNRPTSSDTTKRIEAAMEKYAPTGYDPASDDLTIPFAMELVEKDAEIARLRLALEEIVSPLKFLQERAAANGDRLSEMANSIINSPNYLQTIARVALSPHDPSGAAK